MDGQQNNHRPRRKLKSGAYLALTHLRINLGLAAPLLLLIMGKPVWTMFSAGAVLIVLGAGIRLYSAGVIRKDRRLQRTGPYALCRNPLYLGTLVMMAGFGLISGYWSLTLLTLLAFGLLYWQVIRLEQRWLVSIFGDAYGDYIRETPCLLPTFGSLRKSLERVPYSLKQARANHELKTSIGSAVAILVFLLKYAFGLWVLPLNLW